MNRLSQNPVSHDPAFVRSMLTGLAVKCPLKQSREDCPFVEIRKLPPNERIRRVKAMSDQEAVGLYQQHLVCLEGRCHNLRR